MPADNFLRTDEIHHQYPVPGTSSIHIPVLEKTSNFQKSAAQLLVLVSV